MNQVAFLSSVFIFSGCSCGQTTSQPDANTIDDAIHESSTADTASLGDTSFLETDTSDVATHHDTLESSGWSTHASQIQHLNSTQFGKSIALSGDGMTLVVGDSDGMPDGHGMAVVYSYMAGTWSHTASLTRPEPAVEFGTSVDISTDGNTIVVGDNLGGIENGGNGIGTVVVYSRTMTGWSMGTHLARPSDTVSRNFGLKVSISANGNALAVGDYNGRLESSVFTHGVVSVYSRISNIWSAGEILQLPNDVTNFGIDVAISDNGTSVIVGTYAPGNGAFPAYVYQQTSRTWSAGVSVMPEIYQANRLESVALSSDGNVAVVGDIHETGSASPGSVTTYLNNSGTWMESIHLDYPEGSRFFGEFVEISSDGQTIVVGDSGGGGDNLGAVTIYASSSGSGFQTTGERLSRPANANDFGHGVAVSSDGSVVAVGDLNWGDQQEGAVFIYQNH